MSSPVQVVLNPQNFSEDREVPGGGGPRTDFYADDDAGFVAHKKVLLAQVKTIITELERQTPAYGPVGFVKVILRRKAWAKSHRPLKAIFPERRTPLVGGLDIGQLLLEVDGGSMLRVAQEIHDAEDVVEWKLDEKKDRRVPNPSSRRSEAGAIERIELYGPSDRRQFDLDQAVVWLSKLKTGGQYEVELFEVPPANNNLDAAGERRALFQSFAAGLNALGPGLNASMLPRRSSNEQPVLTVRLERSTLPPRVQLASEPKSRVRDMAVFDNSRERHSRLLGFLERHPLVRRIELPGIIARSAPEPRVRPGTYQMPTRNAERSWPKVGVIVYPSTDVAFQTYHGDLAGFLNEVENAIVDARTRHQVRIFNFSLNVQTAVVPDHYSKVAARLDQIADKHDVLIFISAGNLSNFRPEWPNKSDMALQMMAASQNDGILQPAESARNVSVGALNPRGL
jgi:hypothetical protein